MMVHEDLKEAIALNLDMIVDFLEEGCPGFQSHRTSEHPTLRSYQLYCGQAVLREDVLYLIPRGEEGEFPKDRYSYVTNGSLDGNAPHIRLIPLSFGMLMNRIIGIFQQYQQLQRRLSDVIASGGSLTELLRVASGFLHNPVYVHDNMFAILAESHHVEGMLKFEYNEKTQRMHIPLWLINEFKFDDAYRKTLYLKEAGIWGTDQYPWNIRSLFVNLWDGERYLGRMLINEIGNLLQPGQYPTAEFVARYVILWLQSQEQHQIHREYNFEETLIDLISTGKTDLKDLHSLLTILDWKETDRYLCLKLQSQNPKDAIRADSAVNSQIVTLLGGCVTFRYQQKLCAVINLRLSPISSGAIQAKLAPLVRDSYMYAGLSSPAYGIYSLYQGFMQTDITLEYISKVDNRSWLLPFSACALFYIQDSACTRLPSRMVAHPTLVELRELDMASGSQYYETLRMYLLCERNIPQTAQALIIHRTTLTYRLKKIQELTRLNLDDGDLRLYLLLSYHLLSLEPTPDSRGHLILKD